MVSYCFRADPWPGANHGGRGVLGVAMAHGAPVVLLPHRQAQLGTTVRESEATSRSSRPNSSKMAIAQQSPGWVETYAMVVRSAKRKDNTGEVHREDRKSVV